MFFGEGGYVTIPDVSKPGRRVSIIMFLFLQFSCVFQACLQQEFENNNDKIIFFRGCFYKEQ